MMRLFYLLLLALLFISCKEEEKESSHCQRAFYYWKTVLSDFNFADTAYKELKVNKIYLRFFDVAWSDHDSMAVPIAPLDLSWRFNGIGKAELVPVVFITNETFKHSNPQQSKVLALQVYKKMMSQFNELAFGEYYFDGLGWWEQNPYNLKTEKFDAIYKKDSAYAAYVNSIKEIQFDCDWTQSTRASYFSFLAEMNKLFSTKMISSTLRLYQYKYPEKAGVPPVKRVMLMCYNAGDITKATTANSIFDEDEVMSYLREAKKYPLGMDYAFPVFKWGVVFRENKFVALVSNDIIEENQQYILKDSTGRVKNWVTVAEDFNAGDDYTSQLIRKGDRIRLESLDWEGLYDVAEYIEEQGTEKNVTISLFELNKDILQSTHEKINKLYTIF